MVERLQRLEENLRELQRFRSRFPLAEIRRHRHLEWALRYGLLEAVQIVLDIACHLVARDGLGVPSTCAECIEILEREGYLTPDLGRRPVGMVGLRNLLVHEYIRVDLERLYGFLERLDDFRAFAGQVGRRLME